ncbi:hypothetical protein [Streptomyces sp. NPDC088725]|uniref:hypothetical protein n=1 Tax=Streptomyces sp. NPDC088725 TaxID=3365873 RepID=UPI0037F24951
MRLRTTVAAALGALTLLVSLPGSASAAEGRFEYVYTDHHHHEQIAVLAHPAGRECIPLPGADKWHERPAHSPRNRTNASATVFKNADCTGEYYTLRPGGSAGKGLEMRSVIFS